jgi:hypothetical protein
MQPIKVGPVPGYEDIKFLNKTKPEPKRLKWHTSYGSLYVYDDNGNSATIARGSSGLVDVQYMYAEGEELQLEECDYDLFEHVLCPFTEQDLEDYILNYRDYVGYKY